MKLLPEDTDYDYRERYSADDGRDNGNGYGDGAGSGAGDGWGNGWGNGAGYSTSYIYDDDGGRSGYGHLTDYKSGGSDKRG